MRLPFDRIDIQEGTATSTLSVERFLAIPLRVRVRLLLERRVSFRGPDGVIDTQVALSALHSYSRQTY